MSDDKRRVYKLRLEDKGPWCVYDSLNELVEGVKFELSEGVGYWKDDLSNMFIKTFGLEAEENKALTGHTGGLVSCDFKECVVCNGTGTAESVIGDSAFPVMCEKCNGEGHYFEADWSLR